ncbi:MAG: TolC family protein [Alphaproteobacteria bacterium]|nr:TolC family protein [Alphaproteobacteria bacterium]
MSRWMLPLLLALASPAWASKGAGVALPSLPSSYAQAPAGQVDERAWWTSLGEPRLEALIDEALSANLDLQVASDRILQARALALTAGAALMPQVTFDMGINAQPAALRFAQFTGGVADDDTGEFYYFTSATFNAALPIDLTGQSILGVQAATSDRRAAEEDRARSASALASSVAAAWLDVGLATSQVELVERQLRANRDVLTVVELRLERGEATAVDVLQQRQQVAASEAQLPLLRANLTARTQALAVLLGRLPGEAPADLPTHLPELPSAPGVGAPSDLVDNRPDLRAMDLRLTSAWRRRLAAERAFLPTLRLTANAGWNFTNNAGAGAFGGGSTDQILGLFTQLEGFVKQFDPNFAFDTTGFDQGTTDAGFQSWFTWGIGAQLQIPLFVGGRIGGLKQARAAERIAAHQAAQARLAAVQQVESSWTLDREQAARLDAVRTQATAADGAYEAAAARYADGVGDYLQVLTTLVTRQAVALSALQAHRDALATRIQLHEATGGPWTRSLGGTP